GTASYAPDASGSAARMPANVATHATANSTLRWPPRRLDPVRTGGAFSKSPGAAIGRQQHGAPPGESRMRRLPGHTTSLVCAADGGATWTARRTFQESDHAQTTQNLPVCAAWGTF